MAGRVDALWWACVQGHDAPVLSVAFDPKNEFLASADADGTVCLWNLSSTKARGPWGLANASREGRG